MTLFQPLNQSIQASRKVYTFLLIYSRSTLTTCSKIPDLAIFVGNTLMYATSNASPKQCSPKTSKTNGPIRTVVPPMQNHHQSNQNCSNNVHQ